MKWMKWFWHRHNFDMDKWVLIGGGPVSDDLGNRWHQWIYTNTCKECGMLVQKRIKSN